MENSKLFQCIQRDFRFSRAWIGSNASLLAFTWLLLSIARENSVPYFDVNVVADGLALAVWVFLMGIVISPLVVTLNYVSTVTKRKVLKKRERVRKNYIAEFASHEDLKEVEAFGRLLVGDSHIDLKTLERRHLINSNIVTCLYSVDSNKKKELIGYYILYPLTLEAYKSIHAGEIINGRGIQDHHISSSFVNAAALYIGMAGGAGGHADGYVIEEMIEQISGVLHSSSLKAICTRGATEDGKRVVRDFSFQKLSDPSEISCLPINKEVLSSRRIKRHLAYR